MNQVGGDDGRLRRIVRTTALAALMIILASLVPALASSNEDTSEVPAPAGGPENVSEAKRAAEIDAWRERRAASSFEDRKESQTAFEALPRNDAATLAQDSFEDYFDSLTDPILAKPGDEILSYETDHVAIVDPQGNAANQLMVSSLPLRVEGASGRAEPVDLELERSGDAYEPGAVGTGLSFPTELEEGIEIGDQGVSLGVLEPEDASAPLPIERSDSLFYADVATDTDLVVSPTTGGFRFAVQLRSASSPERISLPLDLPAGAEFEVDPETGFAQIDPVGPSEIVVTAPVALDADGRPVGSRFEANGEELILIVDHEDGNPRMPILVDPAVHDSQIVSDDYFHDNPAGRGWNYWKGTGYSTDIPAYQGFWGEVFGPGSGTGGLFTWFGNGLVYPNTHGIWSEAVPHNPSTSAYYNYVKFQDISFIVQDAGGYYPFLDFGVVSPHYGYGQWRNTWYGQFSEPYFWMGPTNDSSYKQIQFDLNSGSQYAWDTAQQYRYGYLGGITTYIGDTESPSVSTSSVPSNAWTSNPPATSFTMNASDGGLGIKTTMMRAGETPPTTRTNTDCAGWHSASACPQVPDAASFRQLNFNQASLGDGVHHLYGRAIDVVDKDSGWVSVGTVRNDRTDPNPPALSGPLAPGSSQEGKTLTVQGADAHSGVRSIALTVDGQTVDPVSVTGGGAQDCPNVNAGGCARSLTYSPADSDNFFRPGTRTLTAIVNDQVGRSSSRSWTVTIPPPSIAVSGELKDAANATAILTAAPYSLDISARGPRGTSPSLVRVTIDGTERWSATCANSSPCDRTWTLMPKTLSVGSHRIIVEVVDRHGTTASHALTVYASDSSGIGEVSSTIYEDPSETGIGESVAADDVLINPISGNGVVTGLDVSSADGLGAFGISRTYNTTTPADTGAFGAGWRMSVGEDVALSAGENDSQILTTPSGAKVLFVPAEGDRYEAAFGSHGELTWVESNGTQRFELFMPEFSESWIFNAAGQLTDIQSTTGVAHLTYTVGRLTGVSFDDGTPALTVNRNGDGTVSSITQIGRQAPVASYSYAAGRLNSVTDSVGHVVSYTYGGFGAIASSSAERPSYQITTDSASRATSFASSGGGSTSVNATYAYQTASSSGWITGTTVDSSNGINSYSVDAGRLIRAEAGSHAPTLTVASNLPNRPNVAVTPGSNISVTVNASGTRPLAGAALLLDGSVEWERESVCVSAPCQAATVDFQLDPESLLPGDYAGLVLMEDVDGHVAQVPLTFRISCSAACGFEPQDYQAPQARTPAGSEVLAAQRFRMAHGFDAGTAVVTQSFQSLTSIDAISRWGIPLTDSEEWELSFRNIEMADAMGSINAYGDAQANYAGTFIDQASGGKAVAQFVDPDGADSLALTMSFRYPSRLEIRDVDYALAQMESTAAAVEDNVASLRQQHVKVLGTSVDISDNRVEVRIGPRTASGPDSDLLSQTQAEALLQAAYTDAVRVSVIDSGADSAGRGKLRGGTTIRSSSGARCTAGFTAKRSGRGHGVSTRRSSITGILTTGHCENDGADSFDWRSTSGGRCSEDDPCPIGPEPEVVRKEADAMFIRIARAARRRATRIVSQGSIYSPVPVGSVQVEEPIEETDVCIVLDTLNQRTCDASIDEVNGDVNYDTEYGTDGFIMRFNVEDCCPQSEQDDCCPDLGGSSGGSIYIPFGSSARALALYKGQEDDGAGDDELIGEPIFHIRDVIDDISVLHR